MPVHECKQFLQTLLINFIRKLTLDSFLLYTPKQHLLEKWNSIVCAHVFKSNNRSMLSDSSKNIIHAAMAHAKRLPEETSYSCSICMYGSLPIGERLISLCHPLSIINYWTGIDTNRTCEQSIR